MCTSVEHGAAFRAHEVRVASCLAAAVGVAERAVTVRTEHRVSCCIGEHPRPQLERRTVAHVLRVAARQLGHPIAVLVAAEADDRPLHFPRLTQAVLPGRPQRCDAVMCDCSRMTTGRNASWLVWFRIVAPAAFVGYGLFLVYRSVLLAVLVGAGVLLLCWFLLRLSAPRSGGDEG